MVDLGCMNLVTLDQAELAPALANFPLHVLVVRDDVLADVHKCPHLEQIMTAPDPSEKGEV